MAIQKLIVAGFGGQGVMLIGQMIAYAGMLEGKHVTWLPAYGPEMRGGTANCSVIVSDKEISSPVITKADAVIAMNFLSLIKFEQDLKPEGKLFINRSLIEDKSSRQDVTVFNVDANTSAIEIGNAKAANMVMLGAIIVKTGIVSVESLFKVMEKVFTGSKAKLIPMNKKALIAGTKLH